MALPFTSSPIVPEFRPIAGYPKDLCIFSTVQLHPHIFPILHADQHRSTPPFLFLDLLFTGSHLVSNALTNLRLSWKPPYNLLQDQLLLTDSDKQAFLCALQNGTAGRLPIPYAIGSAPICIDTGASASISNCKDDFIDLRPVQNLHLKGIATGLPIEGIGTLNWTIATDSGTNVTLQIRNALYVPSCPMHLLSPQQLARQTKCSGDGFNALAHIGCLRFAGHYRTVLIEPSSNLPILHTVGLSPQALASTSCVPTNISMTTSLRSNVNSYAFITV
jgi:hypothetical protein